MRTARSPKPRSPRHGLIHRAAALLTLSALAVGCADQLPTESSPAMPHIPAFSHHQGSGVIAYVANASSSTVSMINTATVTVEGSFPLDPYPSAVAITPDGSHAYVGHSGSESTVSVVDLSDNSVIRSIPVGARALEVAITPDGSRAYVAAESQTLTVINTTTHTTATEVVLDGLRQLRSVAITPDGSHAYVGGCPSTFGGPALFVVSTATNTVVSSHGIGTGCINALAFVPDGSRAYASNGRSLRVIDTSDNTLETTVSGYSFSSSGDIAITPDGNRAYVGDRGFVSGWGNTVVVVNTADHTIESTITVGSGPSGIAITPDGTRTYVSNRNSASVSVINTATDTVENTVPVGVWPSGIAFGPSPGDDEIEVEIDIQPGGEPNSINLRRRGVTPVAILGSMDFDVTAVDVTSIAFGPEGGPYNAVPAHDLLDPDTHAGALKDVNGDGLIDLMVHFPTQDIGFQPDDTAACVVGTTTGGVPFQGCDAVRIVR